MIELVLNRLQNPSSERPDFFGFILESKQQIKEEQFILGELWAESSYISLGCFLYHGWVPPSPLPMVSYTASAALHTSCPSVHVAKNPRSLVVKGRRIWCAILEKAIS